MKGFRIDPKTFLGLAMPNQFSQTLNIKLVLEFWARISQPSWFLYIVYWFLLAAVSLYMVYWALDIPPTILWTVDSTTVLYEWLALYLPYVQGLFTMTMKLYHLYL